MDRQQIGLKLALDALGRELHLDDFDSRLTLQKTIYLVQAAGVDLGYSYRWYLRDPYSPGLTRDAFAVKSELRQDPDAVKDWKFDPTSVERLLRVREFLQGVPAKALARWLELLASVHFLIQTRQANAEEVAGLRTILLRNDKDYSELDIRKAIEELEQHGFWSR